ncbi:MAG TPA: hypothetical protein VD905_21610, partial [Flavobacteriales bacterium]|nr:hypothetical protein [Flavobacteriales bacterium]
MKKLILSGAIFTASLQFALAQGGAKWSVGGNSCGGSDFLGTTNNQDLIFKSHNLEGFRLTKTGNVGIGIH